MKVLVTGANGFVGKNLISTLKRKEDYEVYSYDINNTKEELMKFTKDCDFVVHLAGVNRPERPEEFYEGNAGFTETLCNYLEVSNNKAPILISSSIQAELNNDYGKSKREGEELLINYGTKNGVSIYIYRFANLFGKWCRPNYNSVVATWCNNIAHDLDIQINDASVSLTLTYIDDVISEIMNTMQGNPTKKGSQYVVEPEYKVTLGELAEVIKGFKSSRLSLNVPKMSGIEKKLYSTYLSYLPDNLFGYSLKMNCDERGSFTEFLKTQEYGQVSVNISKPGITKGNHWHHSKNEKFLVVSGKGLIQFRDIFNDKIIEYHVSGEKLEVIDIPTGYTHNIINVGTSDMVTIMWANEQFDVDNPDTYFEKV